MNNRKIILIILVVVLLTVALWGILVWLENYSRSSNLRVNKISEPTTAPTVDKQNTPAPANISEEAIQQKIEEKKEKLKVEAVDRPYNTAELDFINNPRQAVINELSQ